MKFKKCLIFVLALMSILSTSVFAENIKTEFTIPEIKVNPYHRPYIAVWLETKTRKGVITLAIWSEQDDWLKDLRQWWRKIGREDHDYDAVSGATRKPDRYIVSLNTNSLKEPLPKGVYYLNFESSREEGGRTFVRQKIILGESKSQSYHLAGGEELSDIKITIDSGK